MIAFDLLVEKAKYEQQHLSLQKEILTSTEGLHNLLSEVTPHESSETDTLPPGENINSHRVICQRFNGS